VKPTIELEGAVVFHGSNLDVLPTLADNSVDSIVTDPPYELGFMGKSWDSSGIAYSVELWKECLRVLKPGGHILAFGASRTWHRVAVAIEDAGFELRDSIAWLYGSGFPKSLDVSKAIDKAAGVEREVLVETVVDLFGVREEANTKTAGMGTGKTFGMLQAEGDNSSAAKEIPLTAPATEDAKKWAGWGTALKPAFEPVVVGRKPLIGTVVANVLEHGVGALNIDGSRIGTEQVTINNYPVGFDPKGNLSGSGQAGNDYGSKTVEGRWPANVILDPYTAELLDEQSGITVSKVGKPRGTTKKGLFANSEFNRVGREHNDSGGASRFFYVAKASKRDRNEGLEGLPLIKAGSMAGGEDKREGKPTNHPERQNFHPTVKPTDLMRYLIKLVTPAGGVVLDPFTGSGSTGKAALLDGYQFVGIELTEDYLPIIQGRLQFALDSKKADELLAEIENEQSLFTIEEQ
jgi:site-specific DNA-methyltransferase (adenine-specific)